MSEQNPGSVSIIVIANKNFEVGNYISLRFYNAQLFITTKLIVGPSVFFNKKIAIRFRY